MPIPQITQYPEALQVLEDNGYDAVFESGEDANEVILKLKRPGSWNWNIWDTLPANRIPDPNDKEACQKFWDQILRSHEIFPKRVPTYTIKSEGDWLAVGDSQPDDDQPVVVSIEIYAGGRRSLVATYRAAIGQYSGRFEVYSERGTITVDGVTHWLPLPNDPPRRPRH